MKYLVNMDFEVFQLDGETLLAKFNDTVEAMIPSYASQDSMECQMHVDNQARLSMFYRLRRDQIHGFPPDKRHLENALVGKSFIVRGELRSYRAV